MSRVQLTNKMKRKEYEEDKEGYEEEGYEEMNHKEKETKTEGERKTNTSYLTMNRFLLKVKYSFSSTLIFLIFANPETLKLLQSGLGIVLKMISSDKIVEIMRLTRSDGVPTTLGLFGMSGLFFSTMLALMLLPNE